MQTSSFAEPLDTAEHAARYGAASRLPFTVTCRGTRGSMPVPGPDTVRYGGNTPCLEIQVAGLLLVFDAGTGLRSVPNATPKDASIETHLFISHYHWDHIQGLPFVPWSDARTHLCVHGPGRDAEVVRHRVLRMLRPVHFPGPASAFSADLSFRAITQEPWRSGPVSVTAFRTRHTATTYGFRIQEESRAVVYIPDSEIGAPGENPRWYARLVDFVAGADLLFHDAMFTEEEYATRRGWGHSTHMQAVQLASDAGVGALRFFHHAPERTDTELAALVAAVRGRVSRASPSLDVDAAMENAAIEIVGGRVAAPAGGG